MDPTRLDLVLQYALAVAARQDDRWEQELGPIHLIKYAYLADLSHAARHSGETYTGVPWRFFHFGPWAGEVNDRIPQAVEAAGAEHRTFTSAKYDGERSRYRLEDRTAYDRLERALPPEVASSIKWAVHEFTNDTYTLLNQVYLTDPMLRAAPGEYLVFRGEEATTQATTESEPTIEVRKLSRRESRGKEKRLAALRKRVRERLRERVSRRHTTVSPPPRYDEIFFEGLKWLDDLAGKPVEATEAEAAISDDIWKSDTRGRREIP